MGIDDTSERRIRELIEAAEFLESISDDGPEWLAFNVSARTVIENLCTDGKGAYRVQAREIDGAPAWQGSVLKHLLEYLLADVKAGLLVSVADRATGQTFDDFLDHADAYLDQNRAREAAVIAGVVFEDSVRRICRKHSIEEKDEKLDALISALTKAGRISGTKAKRARAAAHVRTKATHAQWDEFDLSDVRSTVDIARELIMKELDA